MNVPPEEFIRVSPDELRNLAVSLFTRAGAPQTDAELIAELLVDTDLRGVFSHGTRCAPGYVRGMLDGSINPAPRIQIASDEQTTAIVDGDGGLGHLATHRATQLAIARAKATGVGAVVSRHHAHFGSAGKYNRMIAARDCAGFCVSGHTMGGFQSDQFRWNPIGNPPMSFAFPSGEEAPLNLDMGTSFFEPEDFSDFFEKAPAAFFKSIGLVGVANFLGGVLAGMMLPEFHQDQRRYSAAGYGAFVLALDIARFVSVAAFKQETDRTMRDLHDLPPWPGYGRYNLPGGPEWEQERNYAKEGIPMDQERREELEAIAGELGIDVPWT